jgi:hypothetical protein
MAFSGRGGRTVPFKSKQLSKLPRAQERAGRERGQTVLTCWALPNHDKCHSGLVDFSDFKTTEWQSDDEQSETLACDNRWLWAGDGSAAVFRLLKVSGCFGAQSSELKINRARLGRKRRVLYLPSSGWAHF